MLFRDDTILMGTTTTTTTLDAPPTDAVPVFGGSIAAKLFLTALADVLNISIGQFVGIELNVTLRRRWKLGNVILINVIPVVTGGRSVGVVAFSQTAAAAAVTLFRGFVMFQFQSRCTRH